MAWSDAARLAAAEARRRNRPSSMHRRLVVDALQRWRGSPSSIRIHLAEVAAGRARTLHSYDRARAMALAWELKHNLKANPKMLYRGGTVTNLSPWTENKAVAKLFAKSGGGVFSKIGRGSAKGLRLADYMKDRMFAREKEWIVPLKVRK